MLRLRPICGFVEIVLFVAVGVTSVGAKVGIGVGEAVDSAANSGAAVGGYDCLIAFVGQWWKHRYPKDNGKNNEGRQELPP